MAEIFCCGAGSVCENYQLGKQVVFNWLKLDAEAGIPEYQDKPLRWVFLLGGNLIVRHKEKKFKVDASEMFLLPSAEYSVWAVTGSELMYLVSDRPTEYCRKMVEKLTSGITMHQNSLVKIDIRPPLHHFLDLLKVYLKDGLNCNRLFEEKQEELFILLQSKYSPHELGDFLYSLTVHQDVDLQQFIIDNCYRAKNVHELAEICGYSESGFKRVIKEMFNESVYQWMLKQKAERLRKKLAEEEVNLKIVWDEFGFSSPAHFTKFCKQWLGMTPTKYIEELKARQNALKF